MEQENYKIGETMANDYILSQLINENEKEVFKAMRDMRADMTTAKALLNDEQFNTFC